MVATIDPITADPNSGDPQTFEAQADLAWDQLRTRIDQMNAQAEDIAALAADVEADAASAAAAKWVSGSYTEGDIAWSPTDYCNYRCKTTGSRTIDPASDPTNWRLLTKTGPGGADVTSSAVDITMSATSGRLQNIAMTASGKKATLPSATTIDEGSPVFVFVNAGQYRYAVHRYGGAFLFYVNPGQTVAAMCSDNSTGAGTWHVSGQGVDQVYSGNSAEVINANDSRFLAVAMLSTTQAICSFRNESTTYLDAVVLNYGVSSGAAAQVINDACKDISIAAQTSSQATVVYKKSTGETKAVVLDINTSTTFTPGTAKQIDAGTGGSGTAVCAQSSTQLLAIYQGSAASTPKMRVLDIVSSAVNESSEVAADSTACAATYLRVGKVSSSKSLVVFRDNAANKLRLRLQTISVSTPAPSGSAIGLSSMPGTSPSLQFGMAVMSATRAVTVTGIDRTYSDMMISLFDISGSSPVLLRNKSIRVGADASLDMDATKLDANSLYATWTGGSSLGVDGIKIRITNDDQIIPGEIADKLEEKVEAANGRVSCAALDSTHVMQVCRNASTYLSAKTIELAA